jgi:galactonate dehydratase
MKITKITPLICDAYRTNWVFVRVDTDAGLHGVGEATLEYREQTVATAIAELARSWVGQDARRIQELWHTGYRDVYFRGGPVYMSALSAVEMALWDIKGKALGVPVYELFGGKVRDTVPCYANGWFAPAKEPAEFAAKAKEAVAAGFRGLKWDPFGAAYLTIERPVFRKAIECVEAVRTAVGPDVELAIEGHGRFDVPTAVRIGRELQRFDILWFEEPVPPDNLDALAEVKQRAGVPIAAGERLYSRWEYQQFFQKRSADFAQPDVSHVGGLFELRSIAAQAEALHLAVCPHNPSGPVAMAATLQLAACTMNFFVLETMATDVAHRGTVSTERVALHNGAVRIPDGPGLGVDLNLDEIARHPYQPHDLRHYTGTLTDIRPPDATGYLQKG